MVTKRKSLCLCLAVLLVSVVASVRSQGICSLPDDEIVKLIDSANQKLRAAGYDVAVEQIECYTIGRGRPPVRIHQNSIHWVPNDSRRLAQGNDITFMIDPTHGATSSGLDAGQTSAAIQTALQTWDAEKCMRGVQVVERPYSGGDVTVFDAPGFSEFGTCVGGSLGDPFRADIVNAGWYPAHCFNTNTLAFTVTYVFLDGSGVPTDINRDHYLDAAFSEVYYNDAWGNPGLAADDTRVNFPWEVGGLELPAIDVGAVALHENGHALGLGHFGPPPVAVMNAAYSGPRQTLLPIDKAGLCSLWSTWPRR